MKARRQAMATYPPTAEAGLTAAAPRSSDGDRLELLSKLAELRDRGALTESEFAAEKAKILRES